MTTGTLPGIVLASALGILGGAVGTYFSIRNTHGPRERGFMVRAAIVSWIAVCAFVAALLLLPRPYNWLVWIPYVVLLLLAVRYLNRKQAEIRRKENPDGQ